MKILKLDLLAYGPFTNCELSFPAGNSGLHVVFGLNEAGKSSALRGLRHALYGIPLGMDEFVHPGNELRVGLTLQRSLGEQLSFIRRRGRVRTLLETDNKTPLDDAVLEPFLKGISQQDFETRFAIDHNTLITGGRDIAQFKGNLGAALFSSFGGMSNLKDVQNQLKKDAEDLFTPSGRTRRINESLTKLEQLKRQLRDSHIPSKKLADLEAQRDQLRERQQRHSGELQRLRREQTRLERFKDAIPLLGKLRELRRQIETLANVRLVPENFPARRIEAITTLKAATIDQKNAAERRQELVAEMQNISVPPELVDHGPALDELPNDLGSHSKAQQDLPRLHDLRDACLRTAQNVLSELRPDLVLEQADTLKLTRSQRVGIENLGLRHAAVTVEVKQAEQDLQRQTLELTQCQSQLAKMVEAREATGLRAALGRVAAEGPLESKWTAASAEFAAGERQASIDLSKLTLWTGSLDDLEKLSVPGLESIDTHDDALKSSADDLRRQEKSLAQHEADLAKIRQDLDRLRLAEGQIPSQDDLARARQLREHGWQLVKRAWLDKNHEAGEVAAFAAQLQVGLDLPTAYEFSVRGADEVVDRLRRESDRVAHRAQLEVQQTSGVESLEKAVAALASAQAAQESAKQNWFALWQPLGIIPGAPKEMRAWLKQQEALARQAQELRAARRAIDQLQVRIDTAKKDLARALIELGEPAPAESESLVAIQQRAENRAHQIEETHRQRVQLEKDIDRLSTQLESERNRALVAKNELSTWQKEWRLALEPLGLPADAVPSQAIEVLQQISDLLSEIAKARNYDERIASIKRDAEFFAATVRSLAEQTQVPVGSASVDQLARKLIELWREAGKSHARRQDLENELARETKKLETAQLVITRRQSELEAMCLEAGCTSPDELPDLERDSARLRQLCEQSRPIEESLAGLAGGESLAAFEAELVASDADDLPVRLGQLNAEINAAQVELDKVNQELGSVDQQLRELDGAAIASEPAQQVQDLLARVDEDSREYARLRLAAWVLQTAIDRFREKHQGSMLQVAGRYFAELTCNKYSKVQVDLSSDDGQARLVGVRAANQKAVPVEAMSEGTADQLYLALRLASLEVYSQHQEPMPLIVDDVLIQFDNQRAAATLRALASLARKNQVIVFTHHEHLLELAASTLKPDEFSVQHLASDYSDGYGPGETKRSP